MQDFKTNRFPLGFDPPERDASISNLESFNTQSFIRQGFSKVISKLDNAILAGEDIIRIKATRAHIKPLFLSSFLVHIIISKMKKVTIREEESNQRMEKEKDKQSSEDSEQLRDQPTELQFVSKIRKKEAMFINYQGTFEGARTTYHHSLALMYTAITEEGWKLTHGQSTGISQHAGQSEKGLVWNMPFQMTYQIKNPEGWPQLAIVLYGRDYMGRSVARGYGNFHLPASEGSHQRKVRIFEAIPPSTAATCCAYIMGYINQLKNPEKVLLGIDGGRQCLKSKPIGEITVRVQVRRYNFEKYGYE